MGLFKFLKDKFTKKKDDQNEEIVESSKKEEKTIANYDEGMSKSREGFSKRISALNKKFKSRKIDEDYFSSLEEILIEADCGVSFTLNIIEELVEKVKKEKMSDVNLINETLISITHLDQARLQLTRTPRPLPKMIINPDVKSIFDFKYEDFTLVDYDPYPHISAKVSV